MFGAEDSDEADIAPSGGNPGQLANLFGDGPSSAEPLSASTFKYKEKPKTPQSKPTAASKGEEKAPKVLHSAQVQLYQFKDNKHVPVGRVGAAILGNVTSKKFNILLYQSKEKQLANVPIFEDFAFTPQRNNYACFYDQSQQLWYLLFATLDDLTAFSSQVLIAKSLCSPEADSRIHCLDVTEGSGSEVAQMGSQVQIKYLGCLISKGKADREIEGNKSSPNKYLTLTLGEAKPPVIAGLKEGLVGMKKDQTRLVFIPPKLGFGSKGVRDRVPGGAHLIYELLLSKLTCNLGEGDSSDGPQTAPLPKLPSSQKPSKPSRSRKSKSHPVKPPSSFPSLESLKLPRVLHETEEEEDLEEEDEEETEDDLSSQADSTRDVSPSRAKLYNRMARMGQAVIPTKRQEPLDDSASASRNSHESSNQASPAMSQQHQQVPAASAAQPLALFNPQTAAAAQAFSMFNPQPMMGGYPGYPHQYPQQPTYQPPPPQQPPPAAAQSSDQSGNSNLQLVMLESKQLQTDVRGHVISMAGKVDEINKKVDNLCSRDSPFGSTSQVTMEAAVLMQNINRVVQENERLRKESEENRHTIQTQTDKIAGLLAQNQKYLEQSNIMLEQRNESFQSVSSSAQVKITQLEQEKTAMMGELNALNSKLAGLQYEISTLRQKEMDLRAQLSDEAAGKNHIREEIAQHKSRTAELEEDVVKLKSAYKEQRAVNKHAESRNAELEESLADAQAEVNALRRTVVDRKRRANQEKQLLEKEIQDLNDLHQAEIENWRVKVAQQRDAGSEKSLQMTKLESDLESTWRAKCDLLVEQTRAKLDQQIQDANSAVDRLQMELSNEKASKLSIEKSLAAAERKIQELTRKANQAAALEDQLETANDKIASLESDLATRGASAEAMMPQLKKIMNNIYQVLAKQLIQDSKYWGKDVLLLMKLIIKDVTLSVAEDKPPKALSDPTPLIQPIEEDDESSEGEPDSRDESSESEPEIGEDPVDDKEPEQTPQLQGTTTDNIETAGREEATQDTAPNDELPILDGTEPRESEVKKAEESTKDPVESTEDEENPFKLPGDENKKPEELLLGAADDTEVPPELSASDSEQENDTPSIDTQEPNKPAAEISVDHESRKTSDAAEEVPEIVSSPPKVDVSDSEDEVLKSLNTSAAPKNEPTTPDVTQDSPPPLPLDDGEPRGSPELGVPKEQSPIPSPEPGPPPLDSDSGSEPDTAVEAPSVPAADISSRRTKIFDESDSDDDLFKSTSAAKPSATPSAPKPASQSDSKSATGSEKQRDPLFGSDDDDDDDLDWLKSTKRS